MSFQMNGRAHAKTLSGSTTSSTEPLGLLHVFSYDDEDDDDDDARVGRERGRMRSCRARAGATGRWDGQARVFEAMRRARGAECGAN